MTAEEGQKYLEEKVDNLEPVFILRARDVLGAETVGDWISRAIKHGGVSKRKIGGAVDVMIDMKDWRKKWGDKVPD